MTQWPSGRVAKAFLLFWVTGSLGHWVMPLYAFDTVQLQRTLTAPVKDFSPEALARDSEGHLWAVDTEHHRLARFSAAGEFLDFMGTRGKAVGQFDDPTGIAASAQGRVYVADSGNARIQIFTPDGKFLSAFGEKGSAPGQFREPASIAVSVDGVVVVADRDGSRVQMFSADGIFLQSFDAGSPIDALVSHPSGWIMTAHNKTRTVQMWSSAGQMRGAWTGQEPGLAGFGRMSGLAVSEQGFLYVADRDAKQFREMDSASRTKGTFGHKGNGEGQFKDISGLAVRGETIYVADSRTRRITVFEMKRSTPQPLPVSVPLARVQVRQTAVLDGDVDALAAHSDGTLHGLVASRAQIVTWDLATKTTSIMELRKSSAPVKSPVGITAAPSSGSLFVSDSSLDRVVKLDRQGSVLLEFKNLSDPRGVACTAQGVLLVADSGKSSVQAFNHQGLFQFAAGEKGSGPGQLRNPVAVASDKDRIYVADSSNKKVTVFSGSGRFIRDLGVLGPEPLVNPQALVVDREGNVFVLDADRARVLAFDPEGVYIGGFGASGVNAGFLRKPRAMALNDRGDLFIAEDKRIQIFHLDILPPTPANLTATPGEGFISLRWDAVKSRFPLQYQVYRSSGSGLSERVQETPETTWVDDRVTPETPYTYTVLAQSVSGSNSVFSVPVIAAAKQISSGPRLEIADAHIDDVFSAYYKVYSRTPFATVTIKNNSIAPATKVKLSFAIQDFMDFPTDLILPEVRSMETRDVSLKATFNNKILSVTETTPIQAQVKLTYFTGEQETSVTRNLPFKLYSRNAIRWDRKERFAAFVTPNDPPILEFARSVSLPYIQAHAGAPLPASIATAWSVFSGLGVYGMHYAPRPNNPYDRVSLDSTTVDSLQFARETLSRQSGDCADVVALLASSLESLTISVTALDAPGHLFLMFDTGESHVEKLGFSPDLFVSYAGTYWVPLEATMLGQSFTAAWKQGAEQYKRWAAQGKVSPIDLHLAWGLYEPATLPDTPSTVKPPTVQAMEEKFLSDWKMLVDWRWQSVVKQAQASSDWLQAGLIAIEFKKGEDAKKYFLKAKEQPSTAAAALNNLGNLAFMAGDYPGAIIAYQEAALKDPKDPMTLVNMARAQKQFNKPALALDTLQKAWAIDSTLKGRYADLDSL